MNELEITMTIFFMAEGDKSMSKYESKYVDCVATCACGATFKTRSVKETINVEVCNECHPFYKGGKDSNLVSKTGRVEKFNRKYGFTTEAK